MDDAALHRWQSRLLELLHSGATPEEIRRTLAEDPQLLAWRDHALSLDLHALRVATELVAKWGRRAVSSPA